MSGRMERDDVLVVGGGILGLSIAFEAARAGLRVRVLEAVPGPARSAARVAAGMIAPVLESETEEAALVALALESCRRYPAFVEAVEAASGLRCGYRTEGTLLVAARRDHLGELERTRALSAALGLSTEWLTPEEALAREPHLSPRLGGALYAEMDRQVDPRALLAALVAALPHAPVPVALEAGVEAVELLVGAGRVQGVRARPAGDPSAPGHVLEAAQVVVAGGAWARPLLEPHLFLPLRPVKGQILRLQHAPGASPLIKHVVRTPEVYLAPRLHGELVVGATCEEQGFDPRPTAGGVLDLLREAFAVLPGVYELELAEVAVGFRPALRDHLPALGPTPVAGLHVALGHYRHGVMLAPATADLLVRCLRGEPLAEAHRPFAVTRFQKVQESP